MKNSLVIGLKCSVFLFFLFTSLLIRSQTGGGIYEIGPLMNRTRIVPNCAALDDGRVIAFGGREYNFISSSYADAYNPVTNTFTEYAMNSPHDGNCVVRLTNGQYMVIGGSYDLGVPGYSAVEMYDPNTNEFTLSQSMAYERMQHNATQLTSGEVLIAGAWYNPTAAAAVELYYPEGASASQAVGNLQEPRAAPMIFPTNDGNAVVFGGYGTYGAAAINSVEEYHHDTQTFTVNSTEFISDQPGWSANCYLGNRPSHDVKLNDGRYVFVSYRTSPTASYAIMFFNPETKAIEMLTTTSPILDGIVDGGVYDFVIQKDINVAYLLCSTTASPNLNVALVVVDLTTGYVQHPTTLFSMPEGMYLFPAMTFMPYNNKILVMGLSTSSSTYFQATNQTYIITPDALARIEEVKPSNEWSLYPNPAEGQITLTRSGNFQDLSGVLNVEIRNVLGQLVHREQCLAGQRNFKISVGNFSPGLYTLQIGKNDKREALTFEVK